MTITAAHIRNFGAGVAAFYRNGYRNNLVRAWLPALRGVQEKLRAGKADRLYLLHIGFARPWDEHNDRLFCDWMQNIPFS